MTSPLVPTPQELVDRIRAPIAPEDSRRMLLERAVLDLRNHWTRGPLDPGCGRARAAWQSRRRVAFFEEERHPSVWQPVREDLIARGWDVNVDALERTRIPSGFIVFEHVDGSEFFILASQDPLLQAYGVTTPPGRLVQNIDPDTGRVSVDLVLS